MKRRKRPQPVLVVTEHDLRQAQDRLEALSGCLDETAEEAALIDLIFKVEVYEAKLYWRGTRACKAS